ncbi:PAS domain S-box-containing protein [Belnapia rosea]|uniref:histidine kinase n=2 Tax=Belnapia rosea TaxID=938405 RepID=A0A1G6YIV7_9PROT|nr:PAS domain S-box-containing protein [Belnapia rosea]
MVMNACHAAPMLPAAARTTTGTGYRRWGLSAHLLAFGLVLLLPVLALAAISAWQVAQSYQQAFVARLSDTTRALSLAMASELGTMQTAALAAASALAEQPPWEEARTEAWLRGLSQVLGDARIAVFAGATAPEEEANALVRQILQTGRPALSNLYRAQPATAGPEGKFAVSIGVPVPQAEAPERVVLVTFSPDRLAQVFAAQGLTGGVAGLADGHGISVARSRHNDRFVGTPAPWYRLAEGLQEGVFRGRNFEGVEILFGYHRLPIGEGWGVVLGEPWAAYQANWRSPLIRLGVGAVLAIALAITAAAVLARRILTPVRALRQQAEEVTAGRSEAETRAAVARPAEVAEFEALRLSMLQADAALRAGEAEFRAAFEQAAIAMSQSDPTTGQLLRVNEAYCTLVGRPAETLIGHPFADFIHPEDRESEMRGWQAMARGDTAIFETRKRYVRPDGTVRWASGTVSTVRDPSSGRIVRTLAASQDITERRAAEERQTLLTRELDHRAKNVLAVVQAALRLTPRTSAEEYAEAVEGRVAALARAHALLAGARWSGAGLRELVAAEISVFLGASVTDRVVIEGPPVTLSPPAVQAVSMALHELATNATKHGALSRPGGCLHLSWSLTERPGWLLLRWTERGGPRLAGPPVRRGFGSRVLRATVQDQLGGQLEQAWLPEGLECTIAVPMARIGAAA